MTLSKLKQENNDQDCDSNFEVVFLSFYSISTTHWILKFNLRSDNHELIIVFPRFFHRDFTNQSKYGS